MRRVRSLGAVVVAALLAGVCLAQGQGPALETARGTVDKFEKDTLTVRPRQADGKFGKNLALRVTGTTKVWTLTMQKRAGKLVATQTDTEPKNLQPGQAIAVIYTTAAGGPVLLSAVVQPAAEK